MADDDDFAALFEQTQDVGRPAVRRELRPGQAVDGIVVALGEDTVFVDVGTKAEGRIPRFELTDEHGELRVKLGDRVRATVVTTGHRDAPVLAVSFAGAAATPATLQLAQEGGTPVEGEIAKAVKGGVEVMVGGLRAFCPASQLDLGQSGELANWVGQRHFFRVLEVRDKGRSIVLSRRALLQAEREQQGAELLARLEVGAELEGIVQTIQAYGVFVDLGGIEGLVHVSELAHSRVASPSDVVSVGERVRVKVLSIDASPGAKPGSRGATRVSLSMKALVQPDTSGPEVAAEELLAGTIGRVEGQGVWVDTSSGGGFVPLAELDLPPGSDPRRTYEVGQALEVVVLRRDNSGKLRLSARKVAEAQARQNFREFSGAKGSRSLGNLGDLLRGRLPTLPAQATKAPQPGAAAKSGHATQTHGAPQAGGAAQPSAAAQPGGAAQAGGAAQPSGAAQPGAAAQPSAAAQPGVPPKNGEAKPAGSPSGQRRAAPLKRR